MLDASALQREQLLYVVSALREMSWPVFKRNFDLLQEKSASAPRDDEMGGASINLRRWQAARTLDALGHCDLMFDDKGDSVCVTPTLLARLPLAGPPQAVLCGPRSSETIAQIHSACEKNSARLTLQVAPQGKGQDFTPARVHLTGESVGDLEEAARSLGICFVHEPPAWVLLKMSGTLDDYLASRTWRAGELNWQRRRDFDWRRLQFRFEQQKQDKVRLTYYQEKYQHEYWLWKGEKRARVERDWGRYAVLHHAGVNVLIYDERHRLLMVPASVPLPRLLARALTLCSGFAAPFVSVERVANPRHVAWRSPEQHGFNIYRGISAKIAEEVAKKLGQLLLSHPIDAAL